jgi:predicted DNA-binding helix-hairpin-helix protein
MDREEKIELLGRSAQFDICASSCFNTGEGRRRAPQSEKWIYPAALPNGKTIRLFKVLMSNACRNDCAYCVNRCGGRGRPAAFTPDELARTFLDLHHRGLAQGLFLSSAVEDDRTMSHMLDAVEIIRNRARFPGYIHLKILPGASFGQVQRAAELAQRISINLEAVDQNHLQKLAPDKNFKEDLFSRMRWIKESIAKREGICRGHTTQFVVGATGESDREIIDTVGNLYREMALERAYFSAFQPIAGTPLEGASPTPLMREHRLYQVDFLFRQYRWRREDIIFQTDGNLSLKYDPKMIWARSHPEVFPIEINQAALEELLRIPGVGPRSAKRILASRRQGKLQDLRDLRNFGAATKRAAPYVLINGRAQTEVSSQTSLALWE